MKENHSDEIKAFFNQWNIYQKTLKFNYLVHKEISETLHQFLNTHFRNSFSLLDLGCGDAFLPAQTLKDTQVECYYGIDISSIALKYAQKNMEFNTYKKVFIEGHLLEIIEQFSNTFDVIVAGYSMHHLTREEKNKLFHQSYVALKPQGQFLIYDAVCKNNETRSNYLDREWQIYQTWSEMTPVELNLIHDHIYNHDYPESLETLNALAKQNGFKPSQVLFQDHNELFKLLSFIT